MKILFINVDSRIRRYGLMALSAYIKANSSHSVYLEEFSDIESAKRRVLEISPDFIAYSCMSGEYPKAKEINSHLKSLEHKFISLWGGPHPTYSQEIINDDGVDAVCVGEGEGAILELCDKWRDGNRSYDIKNWVFKVDGKIIKNPVRQLVEMDELPVPDFNIFRSDNRDFIKVYISRGCYFNCTYCFNHQWKKLYNSFSSPVRIMSVEQSIELLKYVKKEFSGKIKTITFGDDIFPVQNSEWVKNFCVEYKKHINMPFHINIQPTMAHRENLAVLKDAGLYRVNFAIESGNEYIRKNILGRQMSNDMILNTANILHELGLFVSTQNIICLPDEDFERAKDTFELNIKCRPHISVAAKFVPFPKTELANMAIDKGYLVKGEFEGKIPDNIHWESILNFKDKKDKLKMEYLVNFFTLGVCFPFLKPLIYIFVNAPESPIFKKIYAHIDTQAWLNITHQNYDQMIKTLSGRTERIKLFFRIFYQIIVPKRKRTSKSK